MLIMERSWSWLVMNRAEIQANILRDVLAYRREAVAGKVAIHRGRYNMQSHNLHQSQVRVEKGLSQNCIKDGSARGWQHQSPAPQHFDRYPAMLRGCDFTMTIKHPILRLLPAGSDVDRVLYHLSAACWRHLSSLVQGRPRQQTMSIPVIRSSFISGSKARVIKQRVCHKPALAKHFNQHFRL